VPETASDPVARFDDEEFDARVREHLDRFGRRLRGLKRTVFFDRIAAAEPAGLDNLADRCGVSAALTRRVERAVLEPLRRHLARELADSLPTVLGAV
jgi:DNA-directed RNA polymerase sigma subunit (sigma70/sigma32)